MTIDLYEDESEVEVKPKKFNWMILLVVALVGFILWNKLAPSGAPNDNPPGMHVLIVEERNDRRNLTIDEFDAFQSVDVTEWLDKNAKAYRVIDQDDDVSLDDPVWAKLKAMPRTKTPWMYISNAPKSVISVPLTSKKDTLEALKKGL